MEQLERLTQKFDQIFFIPFELDDTFMNLGFQMCARQKKRVLILLGNYGKSMEKIPFIRILSPEQADALLKLYYTYEFADNFVLLTRDYVPVAGLFNYVDTGLLTYGQVWQALLNAG